MLRTAVILSILFAAHFAAAQSTAAYAENIRKTYHIPELSYAVVSADSIFEMQALGLRKANSGLHATLNDRFRIGSNTKAITGFIAAQLVRQGKISWNTQFFDLFPAMKAKSRKEYHHLTLLNLLTFRTKLIPYTYTDPVPAKGWFTGNENEQRIQFAQWFFKQPPVRRTDSVCFSNLGYVAAALMLEQASGKSYKQLVADLGNQLRIDFRFGQPNYTDSLQTWGHNTLLIPEAPSDNFKLNWLLPAGNINVTLPDYVKFIQLQLLGLYGRSELLTAPEFNFLHFGLPQFAVGWNRAIDENNKQYTFHAGNPGTFLTKVYVFKEQNRAIVLCSNAQTDEADEGLNTLFNALKQKYAP